MWMCTRKQQVRCVWECICQPLCSCNTCVIFAWSRGDSTRLSLFFKAPADGQSATDLSPKRQKEEFIFFSGLNTISTQMLGTCNSAFLQWEAGPFSFERSRHIVKTGESRRADGNAGLGTLVTLPLLTCRATNTEQDFTLFLSIILHPDSFQLWPSQTPLKSEMAAFSKDAWSNFLEVPQAFALSLSSLPGCTWGPLCSCKGSVLHVWSAPPGKE